MRAPAKHWLFKSEPGAYSIDDLARDGQTFWDGVRNYQARNLLRDQVVVGDKVLFYHSNAEPPAIVGEARVVKAGYPDPTAFDPTDKHFDPKSKPEKPTWFMVDIEFVRKFPRQLSLQDLREIPDLQEMVLLRKGSRLSVQPVTAQEWNVVQNLAG